MEKKQLFATLVIFLLLITQNGYCEDKNVYTSADSKLAIQYPSNWRCNEVNGIPIFDPLINGFPTGEEVVVMFGSPPMEILKLDYEFNNVEEALRNLIDSYSRLEDSDFAAGFELIDQGTDTIDNKEAGFIVYNLTKQNVRKKEYVFFDGERVYSIQYVANSASFDKYLAEAEAIMKSVNIVEDVEKITEGVSFGKTVSE